MVPSGLDNEKLQLQLSRLEEHLMRIHNIQKQKFDETARTALERLVQIAIEESLNIGNHLVSGLGLRRADTYREIFQVLEETKILTSELSKDLQQFATFRNRLVHLYWKISDEEFKAELGKMSTLTRFVKSVTQYVHKRKNGEKKNLKKEDVGAALKTARKIL